VSELLQSTAFGAALVFGFRHGFDWDHIAALTDLTGSQTTSRRSMWLATLYALGHAAMVLVLGVVAIVFASQVPEAVDLVMERFVGASLIVLAAWMVWMTVTTRGAPPLRSRWMLLIDAVRRVVDRRRGDGEVVVIEHSHHHDHNEPMHEHAHLHDTPTEHQPAQVDTVVEHRHLHRHLAVMPADPFSRCSGRSAVGVGLLHGVGAETPTQVLVFAAAANASGQPTSIALLVCFIVGLLASNTLVAAASTLGLRRLLAHRYVGLGLAVVTATFSLVVGSLLLTGHASALPPILGG
jgi:ABC-type nickel/cobalt efflux system permease component RcnA